MKMVFKFLSLAFVLTMVALPARAECYADYKAKRDAPLRLHYGVMQLADAVCSSKKTAQAEVTRRLAENGWTLLNILAVFGSEGLEERKESAGEFFLRF